MPETTDRLRWDIDRGKAGDKAPGSDPAAAPLGLDFEAAGTPPSEKEITRAREAETQGRPHDDSQDERGPGHAWTLILFAAGLALAFLGWMLWAYR